MRPRVRLTTQLRVSRRGLGHVFANPLHAGLATLIAFIVLGCIVWTPNWRLLGEILGAPTLSWSDKATFFLEGYESLATNFEPAAAISVGAVAILFGVVVTLIVAIGASRADRARSSGGLLAGIVGAGCAACGTSLVAPVLGAVGAGTSLTFIQTLGIVANALAIFLLGYSVFRLGQQAASSRTSL